MKRGFKFDQIYFQNRWRYRKYARPSDWTVIGLSVRWFSPDEFSYRLAFFGLDLNIWFKRVSSSPSE